MTDQLLSRAALKALYETGDTPVGSDYNDWITTMATQSGENVFTADAQTFLGGITAASVSAAAFYGDGSGLTGVGGSLASYTENGAFGGNVAQGNCSIAQGTSNCVCEGANSSVIGGGCFNVIWCNHTFATVNGGLSNVIGDPNNIGSNSAYDTIGGGTNNKICTSGLFTGNNTIAGGSSNCIVCDSSSHGSNNSTIGGGAFNWICRDCSTIAGGAQNVIKGPLGFIGGGCGNCIGASTICSVIGGGYFNRVTSDNSSILGGSFNTACGASTFIGGGVTNVACGYNSVVVGGESNRSDSGRSFVGGGCNNCTGEGGCVYNVIGGGECNTICGNYSSILNGKYNCLCGSPADYSTIANGVSNDLFVSILSTINDGCRNVIYGGGCAYNTIDNGEFNSIVCQGYSTIGNGCKNCICNIGGTTSRFNYIDGGYENLIEPDAVSVSWNSTIINGLSGAIFCSSLGIIGNGCENTLTYSKNSVVMNGIQNAVCVQHGHGLNCNSFIGTGCCNRTMASYSFIGNGCNNLICSLGVNLYSCGAILGGYDNVLCHCASFIVGTNIHSCVGNALHANCLILRDLPTSASGLPTGAVWNNSGVLNIV